MMIVECFKIVGRNCFFLRVTSSSLVESENRRLIFFTNETFDNFIIVESSCLIELMKRDQ